MKNPLLFLVALVFTMGCSASDKIEWVSTTNENAWNDNNPASFDNREYSGFSVAFQTRNARQIIDGLAGCFNELGWEALNREAKF